jgi:thiamine biosynthesis lipoprotein
MAHFPSAPPAHRFAHEAMHTTFHLRICDTNPDLARDMARECFEHLEFLENHLSRFIDGSDISRINHLRAGETLYIDEVTHRCLLLALDGHARTGGLFDITLGSRIRHQKEDLGHAPPLTGQLVIHPDIAAVTCDVPGRELDLGGIGKGFALDQLHQLLLDWGAEAAMLSAGASSLLAFGPHAWPIDLTGDEESIRILLQSQALSASGTGIQGSHIIHPAGESAMPAAPCHRLWVTTPTAAEAEIWSTALMLLDPESIENFIAGEPSIQTVHLDRCGTIQAVPKRG